MTFEEQAAWSEERKRRMEARQAEQERLHALHPYRVPKYLPVDDDEFPDESYTAGWEDHPDDYWPSRYGKDS
jgi:hypothetical protein